MDKTRAVLLKNVRKRSGLVRTSNTLDSKSTFNLNRIGRAIVKYQAKSVEKIFGL